MRSVERDAVTQALFKPSTRVPEPTDREEEMSTAEPEALLGHHVTT
jgi:hypothetical protein